MTDETTPSIPETFYCLSCGQTKNISCVSDEKRGANFMCTSCLAKVKKRVKASDKKGNRSKKESSKLLTTDIDTYMKVTRIKDLD
jgi:transcription elongation factor Elf1